jgi:hypothetical protein
VAAAPGIAPLAPAAGSGTGLSARTVSAVRSHGGSALVLGSQPRMDLGYHHSALADR